MNFLTFSKKLKKYFLELIFIRQKPKKRPKISLLIPFTSNDKFRKQTFKWLIQYWQHELPDAEIVVGHSRRRPFNKNEALNKALRKSTGEILVVLDADAYMPGYVIEYCANRILEDIDYHLWYVPYRHLYRLTKSITERIIKSDPANPLRIPSPPPKSYYTGDVDTTTYGHRYGAMIMIFPREALDLIGCFDERFKGWGGEDIALLRALDTLYGKHKTTNNDVLHLWHPFIGDTYRTRRWKGQKKPQLNNKLSNAYGRAYRYPTEMRKLVDEGCNKSKHKRGR